MPPIVPTGDPNFNTVGAPENAIKWEDAQADEIEATPRAEALTPLSEPANWDEWVPAQAPKALLKSIDKGSRPQGTSKEMPPNQPRTLPPDSPSAALSQLVEMLCKQAETITQGVDRAVSEVRSAAEESVAKLQLARQEIEDQLGTTNLGHKERLDAINAESTEALRKKAEILLEDFHKQLERQIEAQLAAVNDEHTKRLAAIIAGSAEEVRQNSEVLLGEFRKQIQREVETQFETVMAEQQKQLGALVVTNVKQVKEVVANFKDTSTRQLTELKEKNLEMQHQNEEYMRTCQVRVREEIAAARSFVAPRPILWILVIFTVVAIALTSFAFFSTQSVMRMRTDPPAEFVDPNANPSHRDIEEQLARAYWNSTVLEVQRTYKFGTVLPEAPPPEFQIQPKDGINISSKPILDSSRDRYWQRLRKVWDNPQIWHETYEWDPNWIVSPLKSLGLMLRR
jgi:hypothetical protein